MREIICFRNQCSCVFRHQQCSTQILNSSKNSSENYWTTSVKTRVGVSPWSVSSDGSKWVEASSRGNGSRRQDVWNATGRVKSRARIPRPQWVDYHPATATRPVVREEEKRGEVNVDPIFLNFCLTTTLLFYFETGVL